MLSVADSNSRWRAITASPRPMRGWAQPEVKLGLIPGAGGTQRLPRLVGVARAVEMCALGDPIGAQKALECGLIDRLVEGDLLPGAVAFARDVAAKPFTRTRDRYEKLGTAQENEAIFDAARQTSKKKKR